MEESDPKSAREVILEDYLGTVSYAKDILQLLSSEDLLERTVSRVEIMNEIKREMTESSKCLADTTKTLENKLHDIEETIALQYRDVMGDCNSQTDLHSVKEEIHRVSKQAEITEQNLKKLENEKKILKFHKKHRKLQKKIGDVNFDLASNKDNIKGYIRKQGGDLRTFEFDLDKESLCDIADFLWDLV